MLTPFQQEIAIKELVERHYWPEPVARQRIQEYVIIQAAVQVAQSRVNPPLQYRDTTDIPR